MSDPIPTTAPAPKPILYALRWEEFGTVLGDSHTVIAPSFTRAKVPGGWLMRATKGEDLTTLFIPDPEHTWTLEVAELPKAAALRPFR
jgi:hypothetical protein